LIFREICNNYVIHVNLLGRMFVQRRVRIIESCSEPDYMGSYTVVTGISAQMTTNYPHRNLQDPNNTL